MTTIGLERLGGELLNILLCALILAVLAAGAYYAAYRYVELRHNRNTIADEYKAAIDHIAELEERLSMLEAERNMQNTRSSSKVEPSGWDTMNIRG